MAKITRFFEECPITTEGLEIRDIINSKKFIHTGEIDQVILEVVSGAATSAEIQIRYESQNQSRIKLVYLFTNAPLPLHVDSCIGATFGLTNPRTQGDLHLFIQPDADCVLNIRVDMDINRLSGL